MAWRDFVPLVVVRPSSVDPHSSPARLFLLTQHCCTQTRVVYILSSSSASYELYIIRVLFLFFWVLLIYLCVYLFLLMGSQKRKEIDYNFHTSIIFDAVVVVLLRRCTAAAAHHHYYYYEYDDDAGRRNRREQQWDEQENE